MQEMPRREPDTREDVRCASRARPLDGPKQRCTPSRQALSAERAPEDGRTVFFSLLLAPRRSGSWTLCDRDERSHKLTRPARSTAGEPRHARPAASVRNWAGRCACVRARTDAVATPASQNSARACVLRPMRQAGRQTDRFCGSNTLYTSAARP